MDILLSKILPLSFSLLSLIISYSNHCRTGFNLKMVFNDSESFYFDALSTIDGNTESLIASVTISNNSAVPITISDIYIYFSKMVSGPIAKEFDFEYPYDWDDEIVFAYKDENGKVGLRCRTGDGYNYYNLPEMLITTPLTLAPYAAVKGYLLFPCAGASKGCKQKTKIRVVTSRKTKTYTHKFRSKEANEKAFTQ